MNNIVKAVRTLRTLSPEELKLALALTRTPKAGKKASSPAKAKVKRAYRKRIDPQLEA